MERSDWLKEKRRLAEEHMDTLFAPIYDENWGAIAPTHQQFFARFLDACPPGGLILDAACGTGKYWPLIIASGRTVFGVDQSQKMLARASEKFPDVPAVKGGLQELDYQDRFDGAVCMDALENIPPEDWLPVLRKLHRTLKSGRCLYFTVEIADEKAIENAFAVGQGLGLPLVHGEWAHEGGYHYYPEIARVYDWVQRAGFRRVDEAVGDEYHHFLVRKES